MGRKRQEYYKGKYLIALYDFETDEKCYGVFSNCWEMASFVNSTASYCETIIWHYLKKDNNYVCTPYGKARLYLIKADK